MPVLPERAAGGMLMLKRFNVYFAVLLLPLMLAGARPAFAQHTGVGSVSAVRGDLLVKGPDDTEWSYIEKNGVVSDGDLLWCDQDSLAEIAMEHGAWLRLGPDTRIDAVRLPPGGDVRLQRGSIYADLSTATRSGVVVRTSAGRVDVQPGALARVDMNSSGASRVLVRRGRA